MEALKSARRVSSSTNARRSSNPAAAVLMSLFPALGQLRMPPDAIVAVLGERHQMDSTTLHAHLRSIFRFTYRRNMPMMEPYHFTSDAGWGCMIRCAQMLLCSAYRVQIFGHSWRIGSSTDIDVSALRSSSEYCKLVTWFHDLPQYPHIYSIHHFCAQSFEYDKLPGEWIGPHTSSLVLRDLSRLHRFKYCGGLEVHVAADGCVDMDLCEAAASIEPENRENANAPSRRAARRVSEEAGYDPLLNPPPGLPEVAQSWMCSLLVLVPLRLGTKSINEEYISDLVKAFETKSFVGMLGGLPRHALFFVGSSKLADNTAILVGFDPHTTQDAFPTGPPSEEFVKTIHSGVVSYIEVSRLDPSVSLGFLFKCREEFLVWCDKQLESPSSLFQVRRYGEQFDSPREGQYSEDDEYVVV